jgi:hypothetical protein
MKILLRYDRMTIDRGELKLIRVGHALWAVMSRDRARNGGVPLTKGPYLAGIGDGVEAETRLSGRTGCPAPGRKRRVAGEVRQGSGGNMIEKRTLEKNLTN